MELKDALKGHQVRYKRETVYELFPKGDVGIAFCTIKESDRHFHKKATEWYIVTKGNGTAYLGNKSVRIRKGNVLKVPPRTSHTVKSKNGVELFVLSVPPWSKKDHFIV